MLSFPRRSGDGSLWTNDLSPLRGPGSSGASCRVFVAVSNSAGLFRWLIDDRLTDTSFPSPQPERRWSRGMKDCRQTAMPIRDLLVCVCGREEWALLPWFRNELHPNWEPGTREPARNRNGGEAGEIEGSAEVDQCG